MNNQSEQAELLAIKALSFIAEDEDRISRFLELSGVGANDIRARMNDPVFQGGVLDYLLQYEPDLIDFAEWAGIDPGLPMKLRHALPGGIQEDY